MVYLSSFWITLLACSWWMIISVLSGPVEPSASKGVNLLAALRQGHSLLKQVTTTSTTTRTILVTTQFQSSMCAKLVNVTGSCQTRRGGQREQPVVLSFDDDDEGMDRIEDLMNIQPSPIFSIETTTLPAKERSPSITLEASKADDFSSPAQFFNVVIVEVITEMITSVITSIISTRTLFIMNCTPDPFTYFSLCSKNTQNNLLSSASP